MSFLIIYNDAHVVILNNIQYIKFKDLNFGLRLGIHIIGPTVLFALHDETLKY